MGDGGAAALGPYKRQSLNHREFPRSYKVLHRDQISNMNDQKKPLQYELSGFSY